MAQRPSADCFHTSCRSDFDRRQKRKEPKPQRISESLIRMEQNRTLIARSTAALISLRRTSRGPIACWAALAHWLRRDRERVSELLYLLLRLPAPGSRSKHRGTAGETAAATSASEVNRATPQKKSTIAMLVSAEDRPQLGRLTAK